MRHKIPGVLHCCKNSISLPLNATFHTSTLYYSITLPWPFKGSAFTSKFQLKTFYLICCLIFSFEILSSVSPPATLFSLPDANNIQGSFMKHESRIYCCCSFCLLSFHVNYSSEFTNYMPPPLLRTRCRRLPTLDPPMLS